MASMRLDVVAASSRFPAVLLPHGHSLAGSKHAQPGKLGSWCRSGRLRNQRPGASLTGRTGCQQPVVSSISLRDEAETSAWSGPGGPDLFLLDLAERLEDSVTGVGDISPGSVVLQKLHEQASEIVVGNRWPSSKDEAYRFTDFRFLKKSQVVPSPRGLDGDVAIDLESLVIDEAQKSKLVFVDGLFSRELSNLEDLPEEVFAGSVSAAPAEVVEKVVLPRLASAANQDVFAALNGIGAKDLFLIVVPPDLKLFDLIHVLYISTGGARVDGDEPAFSLSCPRLLLAVGKGSEVEIVEEFVGSVGTARGRYWTNAVCDIIVDEGANVFHRYVQEQHRGSVHVKQTSVSQAENSCYKHVEIGLGGRLSRHNLQIEQLGPDTITEMSTFLLSGQNQLHDLHSKLILSHPGGFSRQLHKCIVSESSGHGVFDGNVKVNRFAQQTDAGQLSRCLLLAPRATVNVKPNLQIIADDVKCSHGAAISDFEAEQLFYFQARGIDARTARSALVFSFGAEVIDRLVYKSLRKRVESLMKNSLAEVSAVEANLSVGL